MKPERIFSLIFIILLTTPVFSCSNKNTNHNDDVDTSCLVGIWKEKFPDNNFEKELTFLKNGTGTHKFSSDSTRHFTWEIENNIPVIKYTGNTYDEWKFLLDCEEKKLTLKKIMYYKDEKSPLINGYNMKVSINGQSEIDVSAMVVCSIMGGKNQFLITGKGNGIGAVNLVFRGVTPTAGEYELFYNLNTATFVNAEFTVGSDADIIRGHDYQGDCCGGGKIIITEKTDTNIAGTFDVENGQKTYHLTGTFSIPVKDTNCE